MSAPTPADRPPWQAVAAELLRRRAGAEPRMSEAQLRDAGAVYEPELTRKRIDGLYFATCDVDHPRRRIYQALWDAQAHEARSIIQELVDLGVTPLVFKGAEVGARYDRARAVGERADIDLLVPQDLLWKVKKVLYGRGYMQGNYQRETREWISIDHFRQLRHESQAYELWPFRSATAVNGLDADALAEARRNDHFCVHDDATLVFLKIDVHHNILFNFDVQPFLNRSVPSALGLGRALCPADHLWFSIYRYYGEVAIGRKRTLRGLAWIAPMVSDPEVDWSLLVRTAVEQRATAPCLYWLTFFHNLGARAIPPEVLDQLRAHHDRSERSWGWQLERLFELPEIFPTHLLGGP